MRADEALEQRLCAGAAQVQRVNHRRRRLASELYRRFEFAFEPIDYAPPSGNNRATQLPAGIFAGRTLDNQLPLTAIAEYGEHDVVRWAWRGHGGILHRSRTRSGSLETVLADKGPNRLRVLFRSVSPWEMVDILETREVRGRGGEFAGDRRRGEDCHVWFGDSIAPIIHSGEDYLRYMQGLPTWKPIHAALDQLYKIHDAAYDKLQADQQNHVWPHDRETHRAYTVTRELKTKLGDAYRKAIYGLAKQANTSAAKLRVTSYILVLHDMPGGVMYSDRDSMQRDATEVCFSLSAARSLYDHIARIDLIKRRAGGGYDVVGDVPGDLIEDMKIKLPSVRKATADAALNTYERLRPKMSDWIDV